MGQNITSAAQKRRQIVAAYENGVNYNFDCRQTGLTRVYAYNF